MYGTNEFRKGLKIEIDGAPYMMTECQFVKPGKGNAFTRTKLKHMVSGAVLDRTYKSGEKVHKAQLSETVMQFMYAQGDAFHFMDTKTYEQVAIPRVAIDDQAKWLTEEIDVTVLIHKGEPISIDLPNFVELEVTQCDPAIKGDTKNNATKLAVLSTGAEIYVPMFIDAGEVLRIDTRTGEYVERAKS